MLTCAATSLPKPAPRSSIERLINFCREAATKDAVQFLMTREITHMKAFTPALESLGRGIFDRPYCSDRPTAGLVDQILQ
jgi:Mn-containing catalase